MRPSETLSEMELLWDSKQGTAPGETRQKCVGVGLELLSTHPPARKDRQQRCADVNSCLQ